jgi:hypothetical protein
MRFDSRAIKPPVLSAQATLGGMTIPRPRTPKRAQTASKGVPATVQVARLAFRPAELRHSFAIWSLKDEPALNRKLHLYYCLRYKWSFSVDDRQASVTPLDSNGRPLQLTEAADRLATFT